jgi:hypothetical protein
MLCLESSSCGPGVEGDATQPNRPYVPFSDFFCPSDVERPVGPEQGVSRRELKRCRVLFAMRSRRSLSRMWVIYDVDDPRARRPDEAGALRRHANSRSSWSRSRSATNVVLPARCAAPGGRVCRNAPLRESSRGARHGRPAAPRRPIAAGRPVFGTNDKAGACESLRISTHRSGRSPCISRLFRSTRMGGFG